MHLSMVHRFDDIKNRPIFVGWMSTRNAYFMGLCEKSHYCPLEWIAVSNHANDAGADRLYTYKIIFLQNSCRISAVILETGRMWTTSLFDDRSYSTMKTWAVMAASWISRRSYYAVSFISMAWYGFHQPLPLPSFRAAARTSLFSNRKESWPRSSPLVDHLHIETNTAQS